MSWWSDALKGIELGSFGLVGAGVQESGGVTKDAQIAATIWTNVRDVTMWRSLGWLLLGIVLMLLGVAWWIGPSAARVSPAGQAAQRLG